MPSLPQDLAARIRGGSLEALEVLYRAAGDDLHRVAFRITLSRQDAEDVVHDVFLGLPHALNGYVEHGGLEAWLKRVTARAALMRLRAHRRREKREAVYAQEERPALGRGGSDTLDVNRLLAALRPEIRAVVVLHEIEGLSHPEIGRALNISAVASRVRLWRGLEHLRRLIAQENR